nr:hypothetical protein [Tanacetum cinerariifolium]
MKPARLRQSNHGSEFPRILKIPCQGVCVYTAEWPISSFQNGVDSHPDIYRPPHEDSSLISDPLFYVRTQPKTRKMKRVDTFLDPFQMIVFELKINLKKWEIILSESLETKTILTRVCATCSTASPLKNTSTLPTTSPTEWNVVSGIMVIKVDGFRHSAPKENQNGQDFESPGGDHDLIGIFEQEGRDDIGSSDFTIYEMMKGCSVWSVRYRVDIDDFITPLLEGWSIRSTVWRIVLGEREDDSLLVINLFGKVVQYNLISKMLYYIFDCGSNQLDDNHDDDDDELL